MNDNCNFLDKGLLLFNLKGTPRSRTKREKDRSSMREARIVRTRKYATLSGMKTLQNHLSEVGADSSFLHCLFLSLEGNIHRSDREIERSLDLIRWSFDSNLLPFVSKAYKIITITCVLASSRILSRQPHSLEPNCRTPAAVTGDLNLL